MNNQFFFSQFFYLFLLIYFYVFYRSKGFKENFFFFNFFGYNCFYINIKGVDGNKLSFFHEVFCATLLLISLVLLFSVCFTDFYYLPQPEKPFLGLIEEKYVYYHLEIKKKLIDALYSVNNTFKLFLKEEGKGFSIDLDNKIKSSLDQNKMFQLMENFYREKSNK